MILNRTTVSTVLLFSVIAILGVISLVWTLSRENEKVLDTEQQESCAEHCFPFVSKLEEECFCADLDGRWNPDTW